MQNGDFNEIREMLRLMADRQEAHDKLLLRHSEILVEHDERMERVGRHLEVLVSVSDDLIRNQADRKKRSTR